MPTYDYLCKACGERLELYQSMSEAPKRKCPKCARMSLERQIGAGAGFLFKGGGFYQTDYRSESWKAGEKKESGATASDGGGAKAETPAAKPAEPPPKAEPRPEKPPEKPRGKPRGER